MIFVWFYIVFIWFYSVFVWFYMIFTWFLFDFIWFFIWFDMVFIWFYNVFILFFTDCKIKRLIWLILWQSTALPNQPGGLIFGSHLTWNQPSQVPVPLNLKKSTVPRHMAWQVFLLALPFGLVCFKINPPGGLIPPHQPSLKINRGGGLISLAYWS